MKKILLSTLAIGGLLFAASCQMDESGSGTLTGEVDFTITAGIPGGISTYAPAGTGSHNGGAVLLDSEAYDLRYIMQAYDDGKLAYSATQYVSDNFTTQSVVFEARLIAKKYNFVFWADFVPEDSKQDNYYKTVDLRNITYAKEPVFTDDAMDAYTKAVEVDLSEQNQNITEIKLQRPFGKLRLIATDQLSGDLQNDELPASTGLTYASGTTVPDIFNALTGKADGNTREISTVSSTSVQEDAVVNGTTYEGAYFLIANYIFASDANTGYAMDVTVKDKAGKTTGTRSLSQIPIVKNKLTTVIGNFYSNSSTLEVIVEDPFEQPEIDPIIQQFEEALEKGEPFTLSCDIDITEQSGIQVPAGVTSILDLNGYTISATNGNSGNIKVYGALTIKDSKNGKIVAENDYSSANASGVISVIGEDASLTMEGGYIYAVRDDAVNNGQFGVALNDGADFTMTGGKIEAGWYAIAGHGNNSTQNSVIKIQGGELISTSDYAIYLPQSGTTDITGGTVNGAAGAVSIRRGTLNISGDAVLLSNGKGYTGDWGDGTGNQPNCGIMVDPAYGACTVNISGGTVSTAQDAIIFNQNADHASESTVNVSAGTFSDPTPLAYLSENADVDVILNRDIEISRQIELTKTVATVNFDLNGHELINNTETIIDGSPETDAFWISKGELNIYATNGGSVKCISTTDNDGYRMAIYASNDAVVNIYGGNFYNKQEIKTQIDLIYAAGNAEINIFGGYFESGCYGTGDRYWVLNKLNSAKETAVISVSGGTFINFNPANPNMDDNDTYLAEGYEAVCNGEVTSDPYNIQDGRKEYTVRKKQ